MVGKRQNDLEGDLLPRGAAPNATPRVQKRNGQILFGPQLKRPRASHPSETSSESSVLQHGASLSISRMTVGMTVLGLVTQADRFGTELILPGGLRAVVATEEFLLEESMRQTTKMDVDDASSTDSSDEEADSIRPAWEVLTVGDILPAAVVDIETNHHGKRAVKVSLKPHLVNVGLNPSRFSSKNFSAYGVIKSVEDHGYIVSFGANIPHTAFLPFEKSIDAGVTRLAPGSPITVVTAEDLKLPKKHRTKVSSSVRVFAQRKEVLKTAVEAEGMTYQDLRAGMLLRCRILQEGPAGLSLSAFGVFKVDVDALHIPRKADGSWDATPGKYVMARLLYVDASLKRIGGSLLRNFVVQLAPRRLPPNWKTGTTLHALRVERVKPGFGLFLRHDQETDEDANEYLNGSGSIKEGEQKEKEDSESKHPSSNICIPIFAHISRISDSKGVSIDSHYRANTRIESGARIISVSKFDGVVNVDLRRSVLSRKALSLDEVEVGAIYDCKILSQTTMGSLMVAVDGDPYLKGIVLPAHISDVPIPTKRLAKNPGFRIGATIKCRALSVRRTNGKVLLTARKSLVSPKYAVLTSYVQAFNALEEYKASAEQSEEVESLVRFTGVTKGVTQRGGLLVEFCDKVVGLVPPSELCVDHAKRASQSEIESLYPVGNTVYVRLLKADTKERRMLLSMSLKERNHGTRRKEAFPLGQRVKARICEVDTDMKHFVVVADAMQSQTTGSKDFATASENSSQQEAKEFSGIKCHLPFGHLSDNSGVAEKLESELRNRLKNLETGGTTSVEMPEAMVICYREAVAVLTLKPSLISARDSGHLPETFDDVERISAKKEEKEENCTCLRGYVKALLKSGAIIGFLGECVGFVRNARIADRFISDPSRSLTMHQSVSVIVDSVDKARSRFSLSMRPSDIGKTGMVADTLSLFRSLEVWRQILAAPHVESEFQIGGLINASVNSVSTYGVKYDLNSASHTAVGVAYAVEGTPGGVIVAGSSADSGSPLLSNLRSGSASIGNPAPRTAERVRVLDVDPLTGIVDVSRDEHCVLGGEKKSVIAPGSSFSATVLLVKTAYVILAVKRSKSRTAIAYALGPVTRENLLIQPGAEVSCTVMDKKQAGTRRNLVLIDWESFRGSGRRDQLRALEKDSELQRTISKLQGSKAIEEADLVGLKIAGKVTRKFRFHAHVGIAPGVVGQVHLTNVSFVSPETLSEVPVGIAPTQISDRYMLPVEGTKIKEAHIAGLRLSRAADAEASNPLVVEVSLSHERCFTKPPPVGSKVFGFVKRLSSLFASPEQDLKPDSLNSTIVVIGPTSFVSCAPVDCLFETAVSIKEGTPVVCQITGHGEDASTHTRGVLSPNGETKGAPFLCLVQSVHPGRGVRLSIPWHARDESAKSLSFGFVDVCEVANDYDETMKIMSELKTGNVVKVYASSVTIDQANEGKRQVWLSMRNPKQSDVKDRFIKKEDVETIQAGSTLRGFVKGIGKKGCFVAIGRSVTAQVRLCDLSDEFVKDPEKQFPVGKLVSGKVQTHKLSTNDTRVSLVIRKRPRKELKSEPLPTELKEGSKVRGVVKRVAEYGAVVEIAPRIRALLHKSEADQDRFVQHPQKEWAVGQAVTAIVIKISNGKISLGTKRCYFEAAGIEDSRIDELLAENDEAKIQALKVTEENSGQDTPSLFLGGKEAQSLNYESVGDPRTDVELTSNENQNEDALHTAVSIPATDLHQGEGKEDFQDCSMQERTAPPLDIAGGFDFVGNVLPNVDEDADTDYDSETPKEVADPIASPKKSSRSKREKKKLREAAEREIRIREEALANDPDAPETAEDFERLLLGNPNTSVIWIRYMAFCVQLSQLDKARSIAERALETISLAAEEERVNMWCAYVNLEAQFGARNTTDSGTGDKHDARQAAAVFRVFERACERITDVLSFHLRISSALRFSFPHLADEVLQRTMRRFKSSSEVWLTVGQNQFATGDIQSARKTLERALITVDKRKHVHLISKFAQFEYKYGNAERGRTVFESLIGNLPKRVDLWNIYLDTELSQCLHESKDSQAIDSVSRARQLFERFTSLDLSSKKMKFAFKKWLKFEKTFGTKESADEVKNRARMYVDKSVSATQE